MMIPFFGELQVVLYDRNKDTKREGLRRKSNEKIFTEKKKNKESIEDTVIENEETKVEETLEQTPEEQKEFASFFAETMKRLPQKQPRLFYEILIRQKAKRNKH